MGTDADQQPLVFAVDGATEIAAGIERWIREHWIPGFTLTPMEEWRRHDREVYARARTNVRGRKVYVVTSFASDNVLPAFLRGGAQPFRVKVKDPISEDVPAGTLGRARWSGGAPDPGSLSVELPGGKTVTLEDPQRIARHLHLLGETVDEKIWGTLLFIHSLHDASCGDVTLIGTMLPYMRQDEKDQPRAPIDTAAFAVQMRAAGVSRVIAMDVHSKAAMQNACSAAGVRFDHLEARCLLAREAVKELPEGARVVVCAPDIGASKRSAPEFQETVSKILGRPVGFAIARKQRLGDTHSEITTIIEDPHNPIEGAYVISPDDILATGGTIADLAKAVRARGGTFWAACYTHGLFTGEAARKLAEVPRLIGTRTVEPWRIEGSEVYERLRIVDVAPVFARAIQATHLNGSINDLLVSLAEEG